MVVSEHYPYNLPAPFYPPSRSSRIVKTQKTKGAALTLGASVLWGTSFVAVSIGLQFASPYQLLFERFLVAGISVLVAGAFSRSARIWSGLADPRIWMVGVVYTAAFLFQFVGQSLSGASMSALLSNLFVVFVPVVAYFALKERLGRMAMSGVLLGIIGIVLVYSSSLSTQGTAFGDLLLMGSALGYTAFIVLGKKLDLSSLSSSFSLMVTMAVLSAPVAFIADGSVPLAGFLRPEGLASVLWLGLPCTVFALAMYTKGLASIGAAQSAVLLLMEIIVGMALSIVVLGESLSLVQWVGAGAIGISIVLCQQLRRDTNHRLR